MNKNVLFNSLTLLDDYKKNLSLTYVDGGGSPGVNQWTFTEAENAARINSGSGVAGFLNFKLGYLFVGDVIVAETEFLNISGVKGRIGIDKVDVDDDFISTFITNSSNDDNYESLKVNYLITEDGYYAVSFGLFTSDVGELKIRKPTVKVETINNTIKKTSEISLQNGWQGNVYYKKTDSGIATVYGKIKPGTTIGGTAIGRLPLGFRPYTNSVIQPMDEWGGTNAVLRFQSSGDIKVSGDSTYSALFYEFTFVYFV